MNNRFVCYVSLKQIKFFERRRKTQGFDIIPREDYITYLAKKLEEVDPGAKRSHELAKKYRSKSI